MRVLLLVVTGVLLSACASFKNQEVAVAPLENRTQYETKPSVYIDLKFVMNGGQSASEDVIALVKQDLSQNLINNGIFSEFSFNEVDAEKYDYRLNINIKNHGNTFAATLAGVITGYSAFLIPTFATDNFTVTTLLFKNGESISAFEEKDSLKTWLGIWMLPVMNNQQPKDIAREVIQNLISRGLNDLINRGELKYSAVTIPSVLG